MTKYFSLATFKVQTEIQGQVFFPAIHGENQEEKNGVRTVEKRNRHLTKDFSCKENFDFSFMIYVL